MASCTNGMGRSALRARESQAIAPPQSRDAPLCNIVGQPRRRANAAGSESAGNRADEVSGRLQ